MGAEPAEVLLDEACRRLAQAGCATPRLDARLLLQHAAGLAHSQLIAEPRRPVEANVARQFRALVLRRAVHEPVSRITGHREFYGRGFRLTPAVLDPRPDTETLIAAALPLMRQGCRLIDLGTGSGALAITLLAERPDATGLAVDVSAAALAIAYCNARLLGVETRLGFANSDWFTGVSGRFDLVISNPPYIAMGELPGLPPDVRDHDPRGALDGGADGLDAYREIAVGAVEHLTPAGHVLVEIGAGQKPAVSAIFEAAGFSRFASHDDLAGHSRCLDFTLSQIT